MCSIRRKSSTCTRSPCDSSRFCGYAGSSERTHDAFFTHGGHFSVPRGPEDDDTAPTTSLIATPPATADGWHRTAVAVTLSAEDEPGGSGVAQVTYSVTGAQVVPGTTVTGNVATIPVFAEGVSEITYFAVDYRGNVETAHTAKVSLDQTAPSITVPAHLRQTTRAGTARPSP